MDWSKAMQVFVSGVVGVYLIMGLLMVLTQLGMKAIDYLENWKKKPAEKGAEPVVSSS